MSKTCQAHLSTHVNLARTNQENSLHKLTGRLNTYLYVHTVGLHVYIYSATTWLIRLIYYFNVELIPHVNGNIVLLVNHL